MAIKEITFKEIYTYTIKVDIKENEDIEEVIHNEIPLLVDRSKEEINNIRETGNFDLCVETEYSL